MYLCICNNGRLCTINAKKNFEMISLEHLPYKLNDTVYLYQKYVCLCLLLRV